MTITYKERGALVYGMNEDLAIILLTNLIKNALVHGHRKHAVKIKITPKAWQIENFGPTKAILNELLFSRFKSAGHKDKSTGLGLAIAKAIAEKYHLRLDYSFEGTHRFILRFPDIQSSSKRR